MKTIDVAGNLHYEVTGEREDEAAYLLEEGLSALEKRRNAYVDRDIDEIIRSIRSSCGVHVALKLDAAC